MHGSPSSVKCPPATVILSTCFIGVLCVCEGGWVVWEDHHVTGNNILITQRRDSYIIMVDFTLGDDFTLQEFEEIPREVGEEWEQQGKRNEEI